MKPAEMLEIARKVARKYARSEQQAEELMSVACLSMCEAERKSDGARSVERFMYVTARNATLNFIRDNAAGPLHSSVSIHYAVTELIDEWKREPQQEASALVSEVREIARKALTPPQLRVVLRRAAGVPREDVSKQLRIGVRTVRTREANGMEALALAVSDRELDG